MGELNGCCLTRGEGSERMDFEIEKPEFLPDTMSEGVTVRIFKNSYQNIVFENSLKKK